MTSLDEIIRLLEISGEGTEQKALEILKKMREEQRKVVAKNVDVQTAFEREI